MLVSPTTPTTAFPIGERADDPMAMYLADLCTIPSNLAGNAAMSVPCGARAGGRAAGRLQIMAPVLADDRLYRVAAAVEAALDQRRGHPLLTQARGLDHDCGRDRGRAVRTMTTTATRPVPFDEAVSRYEPVIGLETHVELGTVTKMFCGSPTTFGAEPNSAVCPVCLGLPGSLPVINKAAIEYTIRIGLALNCSIATWCRFARKNYFYPDMPKNFQISQYDEPLCTDGWLEVEVDGQEFTVGIERVHLEEDTGKSLHVGGATGRIHGADYSLVDYNRAGIPLVEIVTKPIPGTGALAPAVARAYVTELRDLLRSLGVSDVRMEQGSLRCDVNTSIAPSGSRAVGHPDRDQERQLAALGRAGGPVRDRAAGRSARRGRPDRAGDQALPRGDRRDHARAGARKRRRTTGTSPSLTWCRSRRRGSGWRRSGRRCPSCPPLAGSGCRPSGAVRPRHDRAAQRRRARPGRRDRRRRRARPSQAATGGSKSCPGGPTTPASSWPRSAITPGAGRPGDRAWSRSGELNNKLARAVVDGVLAGEGSPDEVVAARGLAVVTDTGVLAAAVDEAIAANPDIAAKIADGKVAAAGALVGAVMKATKGQADAASVRELILQRCSARQLSGRPHAGLGTARARRLRARRHRRHHRRGRRSGRSRPRRQLPGIGGRGRVLRAAAVPASRPRSPRSPHAERCSVVQTLTAGIDLLLPHLPPGAVLCNAHGVHDASTAEWVVTADAGLGPQDSRFSCGAKLRGAGRPHSPTRSRARLC